MRKIPKIIDLALLILIFALMLSMIYVISGCANRAYGSKRTTIEKTYRPSNVFAIPPNKYEGRSLYKCDPNYEEHILCCLYHIDDGRLCVKLCDYPEDTNWLVTTHKCHSWN